MRSPPLASRKWALILMGLLLPGALLFASPTQMDPGRSSPQLESMRWQFEVMLDGKPIGTHRFSVSKNTDTRTVESTAQFAVRVLGIPVYRYRHHADESWQGDCLRELRADTEDGGQRQQVEQSFQGKCLMSFAYWNPRITAQQQLVDPQTGSIEAVSFGRLQDSAIAWRGQLTPARGWSLRTAKHRISVWYAVDGGHWIALDAEVQGGRVLSYRVLPTDMTR